MKTDSLPRACDDILGHFLELDMLYREDRIKPSDYYGELGALTLAHANVLLKYGYPKTAEGVLEEASEYLTLSHQ